MIFNPAISGDYGEGELKLSNNIVTEIKKANTFYLAEEHHQRYIQKKL